jgi:hypothetical protein
MDAFSYLSVLISLILGLAITQVLKGIRGLMHARTRLKSYWPAVIWAILIVVISVQSWWAMFGLRWHSDWTFLEFSIVLAQTIDLYLLAALVLPDFFGDTVVDLREHYYAHRRWFFSLLVLLIAITRSTCYSSRPASAELRLRSRATTSFWRYPACSRSARTSHCCSRICVEPACAQ